MNENDFSKKLTSYLDNGLAHIDEPNLVRLRTARTQALAAHREPIRVLGLVTVSGRVLEPTYFLRKPLFWLPILAIVAATLTYQANTSDEIYDEAGTVDAQLLTGELPIDAFLDKDFAEWVKQKEEPQPAQ
jgi:Protein of unknown function (DUF3619)